MSHEIKQDYFSDTISLKMSEEQLLELEGTSLADEEISKKIEEIKFKRWLLNSTLLSELADKQKQYVFHAYMQFIRTGVAKMYNTSIHGYDKCCLCGTSPGFVPFKSGRRVGTPNESRPKSLLGKTFLTSRSYPLKLVCCDTCFHQMLDPLTMLISNLDIQISEPFSIGFPERVAIQRFSCKKCNWEGYEDEGGWKCSYSGGYFFGICPNCGLDHNFTSYGHITGFKIVRSREIRHLARTGQPLDKKDRLNG